MSRSIEEAWAKVEGALIGAHSIAFDGCHKTYVLMDAEQTEQMRGYGYGNQSADGGDGSQLVVVGQYGREKALELLRAWYDKSCALRFIQAVRTVGGDPNEGFTNLIEQGFGDESEYAL